MIDDEVTPRSRSSEAAKRQRDEEFHTAARALRSELTETLAAFKRSMRIERQALSLAVFDSGFRAGMYLVISAAALVFSIAAALLFVSAARRMIDAATDGAWWGDLLVASAISAALVVAALTVRRRFHKKVLERTRQVMEPPPDPEAAEPANPEAAPLELLEIER